MPRSVTRRYALTVGLSSLLLACARNGGLGSGQRVSADDQPLKATVYKRPGCPCCVGYAEYLRQNGFEAQVFDVADLAALKREYNVPKALEGCHTTIAEGYAIEGHVPADVVKRLLFEKPAIRGISLPGMPSGSPGMGGAKTAPFTIFEISDVSSKVFAVE
jgi:hypothetical protein